MAKKKTKPAVRFKGFTDDWVKRKLGDIGSVAMCRRVFKHQTSESGDIPFYKIGTFGGIPDAFISRELFKEFKSKYPYPEKGDILISASGSIGRIVEYTGKEEYFQDSNIVWLRHNNSSAISVAIDDLMIYQDYFESPLVFLHYLKNRREATTIKHLVPTDELDHLGMYIHHNCYSMFFENNKTNRLNPVGYREDLDTYYNQKYHKQLKPTKPVQNIPVLFKKMISYLDKTDLTNRIRVSNYLLDFSTEAKNDFSNQVEGVFKHQKETKRATSVCAAGNGKNSLRYSCFVSEPGVKMISESEQQDYVWSNMLWNDEENRVQVDLNLDADMDVVSVNATFYSRSDIPADRREALFTQGKQRAQDRLNRYIAEHGHKIGRNELCPCGSGKKYKKCCGYYN